eukprot:GFUD01004944.1.p1 GENE.GFUD01004944.1~~GFUD01004944.1.p1  ORF type:complete len:756 (+),score=168.58 GFUD01004944.1:860-3127(+)
MVNSNKSAGRQAMLFDRETPHLQPANHRTNSENTRDGRGEEDPLQNPRPPEKLKSPSLVNNRCHEQNLMLRAKRWSCRLSERASVIWGGWGSQSGTSEDEPPPPVPRHRTDSKYNASFSDRNHVRLLDKRTKSYTCRELMCIVFLPCLLICLLGIACSALVIYYQLGKEYEQEISALSSELAAARDQMGVYMSSHKYQGLIDQVNRQKIAIDNEKEAVSELGSMLKKKTHELKESTRKFHDLKETLDCTWTIIQKTGGSSLLKHLESECKLSQRAHLLLAVNDEAAVDRPVDKTENLKPGAGVAGAKTKNRHSHGQAGNSDRQHWLLGSNSQMSTESNEFQQFLATEFTRMEQNIIDFSNQQDIFCNEFRRSLDNEVEKRHRDLGKLSSSLGKMLETQLKTVGKLSGLATDQLYAEQKWVTGYLKTARNEADKESSSMQKFLTEGILIWLQQVHSSLRDQGNTLDLLQQNINSGMTAISGDRNNFLNNQKKMLMTANNKVKALSQLQLAELKSIAEREEKVKQSESQFGVRFKEAKRKIDGLLSSLLSEYESYSTLINKTAEATARNLASTTSRTEQMTSLVNMAVGKTMDDNKEFQFKTESKEKLLLSEMIQKVEESVTDNKVSNKKVDQVELQTKQFIGERQGAWELHYSNQEIQLRKKTDKNKEILQKHQSQSQDLHSLVRTATNSLESVLETHRQSDSRKTAERQADLQAQCKNMGTFTELLSSELHARDSDMANYFFNSGRNEKDTSGKK